MTTTSFRVILLSALAALTLSPLALRLAPRFKLLDVPGSLPHKKHDHIVPLAGGFVLLVAVLLASWGVVANTGGSLLPVLLMSSVVFVFGVLDDRFGLSAPLKLAGQGLASVGLLLQGVHVLLFPPTLAWANTAITLVWLVGITNAFNFVDSMDGLAVGLAGLAAGFFMLVTQDSGQVGLSLFAAAVLGACVGVFFFNARPAHYFLGDAGSQWLGFVIASLGILYTPQGFQRSQSWFVPILLVGVPIFDTVLIVFSRLRRGLPWYRANMDHSYHRLVRFGVHAARAVVAMQVMQLLLSCLAFVLLSLPPLWANLAFAGVLVGGLALVLWMDSPVRWGE